MYSETDQALPNIGRRFLEGLRAEHANAVAYAERLASTIASVEQTLRALSDSPVQRQLPIESPSFRREHSTMAPGSAFDAALAIGSAPEAAIAIAGATNGWARRLRGMSQHEAVIQIAEDNGGVVRTKDAAEILLKAGLSTADPRNLYRYVLSFLTTSGKFVKAGKGTYRLIDFEAGNEPREDAYEDSGADSE